ncbi:MAG: class I SAM-dependent methyltransferase [Candidatus Dormibacteraceae bacterium]
MKKIHLDPPGTWCQNQAVVEMVRRTGARTFLEVGCGRGAVSALLCRDGLTGSGMDFSAEAVAEAEVTLAPYLAGGSYQLLAGDFLESELAAKVDLVLSLMVMEHVEDDLGFLRRLADNARVGGFVAVAVPGIPAAWGVEDEIAGHFRRYDKSALAAVYRAAGLEVESIHSVGVPVANLLLLLGNAAIRRSREAALQRSREDGTKQSGIWAIPYKTVFPAPFKLILNRFALAPFIYGQRLFYGTDWGLSLLALGRKVS